MKMEMKKKKEEGMDMEKEAKLTALKDLRATASEMMGEGLKGVMSKPKASVTVAADSPAKLKEGLEKAEELLPKMAEMEDSEEESEESLEAEMEELEQKLAAIKAKLNK